MADSADPGSRDAFSNRLLWGDNVGLLVVDMCRAYFEAHSPLFIDRPVVASRCLELVEAARASNVPIYWSRVEFEPGGADGGVFYQKVGALSVFDRGGPLGDWIDGLSPAQGEFVVTKQGASSFFGTSLAEQLGSDGIDTVLIAGVSTSGCVRASALDACQHNLIPVVVADACGDRTDQVHQASLFDLDAKYANVEMLHEVVGKLD